MLSKTIKDCHTLASAVESARATYDAARVEVIAPPSGEIYRTGCTLAQRSGAGKAASGTDGVMDGFAVRVVSPTGDSSTAVVTIIDAERAKAFAAALQAMIAEERRVNLATLESRLALAFGEVLAAG